LGEADAANGQMKPVGLSTSSAANDMAITKEKKLEGLLLVQPVSEHTRETVLQQFEDTTAQQQAEKNFSIRTNDPDPGAGGLPVGLMLQPNRGRQIVIDQEAAIMAGLLLGSPEFQRR
jgi:hypothetical protein